MARSEHERVIGRRRSEPHVAGDTLVGVYDRVYLDAALLLSGPGMSADTLENGIGEQRNGRGINDSKLLYPFFRTIASAVRRNYYFYSWLLMDSLETPKITI